MIFVARYVGSHCYHDTLSNTREYPYVALRVKPLRDMAWGAELCRIGGRFACILQVELVKKGCEPLSSTSKHSLHDIKPWWRLPAICLAAVCRDGSESKSVQPSHDCNCTWLQLQSRDICATRCNQVQLHSLQLHSLYSLQLHLVAVALFCPVLPCSALTCTDLH